MLGTAFPADRILLVEQPGGWGPAGLADSHFDPTVAAALVGRLGSQGVRVLAIRRPGRAAATGADRRWGLADCRPGRRQLIWGSFAADDELLDLDPDRLLAGADGSPIAVPDGLNRDQQPVYAVCAHGTHDMCCAIEGRPVAARLQQLCPDRVWECSHVGGDRFAANVLVLPLGLQYGRVGVAADTEQLVAASEAGRVLPSLLRGRIGLAGAAQAAQAFVQQQLGLTGVDAARVLGSKPLPDGRVRVTVSLDELESNRREEISVVVQRVSGSTAKLTCRASGNRTPLSWTPISLHRDPAPG